MAEPRKQHYLPQFYLRNFSTDGQSIFQIEKTNGKHYGCRIKDVAAIRDYHEIDADDVADPHAIEKTLAQIEGELAGRLQRFIEIGTVDTLGHAGVIELLSMLRMRVPAVKEHIEKSLESQVRKYAELMERSGMFPAPPPGLEEQLKVENLKISIKNWKCLELMFGMSSNPDMLSILGGMRVTTYTCEKELIFITSDQPVALYHPTITERHNVGVGPAMRGVEITFPITNKLLIKLDHSNEEHQVVAASPEDVSEFNRRTAISALKYIFSGGNPDQVVANVDPIKNFYSGFRYDDVELAGQNYQIHRYIPVNPHELYKGN